MTDNFIFIVNVTDAKGQNKVPYGFDPDFDGMTCFNTLDSAKTFIQQFVNSNADDIFVRSDGKVDTDSKDYISTFGIGFGASAPWVTADIAGDTFDFWIHKIELH